MYSDCCGWILKEFLAAVPSTGLCSPECLAPSNYKRIESLFSCLQVSGLLKFRTLGLSVCSIEYSTFLNNDNTVYSSFHMQTHYAKQSPFWESDSHSARQKLQSLHGTRRFISFFRTERRWSRSWCRWIHSASTHPIVYSIPFNITLPSTSRYSTWCLAFSFSVYVIFMSHINTASYWILSA